MLSNLSLIIPILWIIFLSTLSYHSTFSLFLGVITPFLLIIYFEEIIIATILPFIWNRKRFTNFGLLVLSYYYKAKRHDYNVKYFKTTPNMLSIDTTTSFRHVLGSSKYTFHFKKLFLLIAQLKVAENVNSMLLSMIVYVDNMADYYGYSSILVTSLKNFITDQFNKVSVSARSASKMFEQWQNAVNKAKGFLSSNMFNIIRKLLISLTLLPFVPREYRDNFLSHFPTYETKFLRQANSFDLGIEIMDALTTFLNFSYQYFMGESNYNNFIHTGDSYVDFFDKVSTITSAHLEDLDIAIDGQTYFDKIANVEALISDGKLIHSKLLQIRDSRAKTIDTMICRLSRIRDILITRSKSMSKRPTPCGALVYGTPGTGKTRVIDIIKRATHQVLEDQGKFAPGSRFHGMSIPELTYTRNTHESFCTGLTSNHLYEVIDDVAAINPLSGAEEHGLSDVLQSISSLPYRPNMAAVEEKGTVSASFELVIVTTNVPSLNADITFNVPNAVRRRFPLNVLVTAKPEFSLDGTNKSGLDPSKIEAYALLHPNKKFEVSDYKVTFVKTSGTHRFIRVPYHQEQVINGSQLYQLVYNIVSKHRLREIKVSEASDKILDCELCSCNLPVELCIVHRDDQSDHNDSSTKDNDNEYMNCTYPGLEPVGVTSRSFPFVSLPHHTSLIREELRKAGEFVNSVTRLQFGIFSVSRLLAAITIFSTIVAAFKFTRNSNDDEEPENIEPIHFEPPSAVQFVSSSDSNVKPHIEVKDDVYTVYKPPLIFDKNQGGKMFLSHLSKYLTQNTYYLLNTSNGTGTHIGPVCGNIFYCNKHFTDEFSGIQRIRLINYVQRIDHVINLDTSDVIQTNIDSDLVFLKLTALPPVRDLRDYFIKNSSFTSLLPRDTIIIRTAKTAAEKDEIINSRSTLVGPQLTTSQLSVNNVFYVNKNLPYGDCGSAVITRGLNNNSIILGLYAAAAEDQQKSVGVVTKITQEDLCVLDNLDLHLKISSRGLTLGLFDEPNTAIGELHRKSHIFRLPKNVRVFGTIKNYKSGFVKGTVIKGFMSGCEDKFRDILKVSQNYGQPIMKPGFVDGEWKDPYYNSFIHSCSVNNSLPTNFMERCKQTFVNNLIEIKSVHKALQSLTPLQHEQVLNGIDGNPYIFAFDTSTSMGYPYNSPKENFIIKYFDEQDNREKFDFVADVIKGINKATSIYSKGYTCSSIFTTCLKDEAVVESKIGSTRCFSTSQIHINYLLRKYYLPIIAILRKHPLAHTSAVGVNARSFAWQNFYNHLCSFGKDRIVAGDYKKFDKRMAGQFIRYAFLSLIELAKCSEHYSEKDIVVMTSVAVDCSYPIINTQGDLCQFFGINPSGQSLTVDINSICNVFYLMYAYGLNNPVETFFKNVRALTYGDDNIFGVSPRANSFNHTSISKALSNLNIIYTMSDKTSKSIPFINIKDSSFLKRTFYVDERGFVLSPLEKASIFKMLTYRTKIKNTENEHTLEVCNSALLEIFPYGKDIFDSLRQTILTYFTDQDLHLHGYINSWDKISEDYYEFQHDVDCNVHKL
jgi:hypothetical protein